MECSIAGRSICGAIALKVFEDFFDSVISISTFSSCLALLGHLVLWRDEQYLLAVPPALQNHEVLPLLLPSYSRLYAPCESEGFFQLAQR